MGDAMPAHLRPRGRAETGRREHHSMAACARARGLQPRAAAPRGGNVGQCWAVPLVMTTFCHARGRGQHLLCGRGRRGAGALLGENLLVLRLGLGRRGRRRRQLWRLHHGRQALLALLGLALCTARRGVQYVRGLPVCGAMRTRPCAYVLYTRHLHACILPRVRCVYTGARGLAPAVRRAARRRPPAGWCSRGSRPPPRACPAPRATSLQRGNPGARSGCSNPATPAVRQAASGTDRRTDGRTDGRTRRGERVRGAESVALDTIAASRVACKEGVADRWVARAFVFVFVFPVPWTRDAICNKSRSVCLSQTTPRHPEQ